MQCVGHVGYKSDNCLTASNGHLTYKATFSILCGLPHEGSSQSKYVFKPEIKIGGRYQESPFFL